MGTAVCLNEKPWHKLRLGLEYHGEESNADVQAQEWKAEGCVSEFVPQLGVYQIDKHCRRLLFQESKANI